MTTKLPRLDPLRTLSLVVADTCDLSTVRRLLPVDCTTNPSFVLASITSPDFAETLDEAMSWGSKQRHDPTARIADRLVVSACTPLAALVAGRISVGIDVDLSFDTQSDDGPRQRDHQTLRRTRDQPRGVDKTWGSCGAFSVCDIQPTVEDSGTCVGNAVSSHLRPLHPSALSHAGIGNVID